MNYNDLIGKDRFSFWADSPHSKLICGSLICTTTCSAVHLRKYLDNVLEQMAAGRMGNGQYRFCFAGGYMDDSSRFIYEIYDDAGETLSRISRMDDMAGSGVLDNTEGIRREWTY